LRFLEEIFQTHGWPDPTQVKTFLPGPITSRFEGNSYEPQRFENSYKDAELWFIIWMKPTFIRVNVFHGNFSIIEMAPNLTRAYFWPKVNERPTCLWSGYFLIQLDEIFYPKGKKLKNLEFLGEIFQTKDGWPNLTHLEHQKIDSTRPGSKIFDPDPSQTR